MSGSPLSAEEIIARVKWREHSAADVATALLGFVAALASECDAETRTRLAARMKAHADFLATSKEDRQQLS
jgi:hypothetical protein